MTLDATQENIVRQSARRLLTLRSEVRAIQEALPHSLQARELNDAIIALAEARTFLVIESGLQWTVSGGKPA